MARSIEQRGHHVTGALIGMSRQWATYNYTSYCVMTWSYPAVHLCQLYHPQSDSSVSSSQQIWSQRTRRTGESSSRLEEKGGRILGGIQRGSLLGLLPSSLGFPLLVQYVVQWRVVPTFMIKADLLALLTSVAAPQLSASAVAPRLQPLNSICLTPRLHPLQLLLPDCIHLSCCSLIVSVCEHTHALHTCTY